MNQSGNKWKLPLICLLLGAITFAVFSPVLQHEFINYDDPDYVTANEMVKRGVTTEGVNWAFTTGHAGNWHPATWLSHMLDVQLFSLQPRGHHATNLLFHTANAILLLLLLRQMTGGLWRSTFVAALFALHPLHVESVAWVAERKDLLATFFGLLTLMGYARYASESKVQGPKSKVWYGVALLCFALGLMSKPMLVTWPFVLLLLDFWPLGRATKEEGRWKMEDGRILRRLILEKIPFFALAAASCVVTFIVQQRGLAVSTAGNLPMEDRLANAVASYLKYLGKTFWPTDLAIFYPHPELRYPASEQWPSWGLLLAAIILAAISVLAVRRGKSQPYLATGWLWYLGTLVPTIGIIQVGTQAMADRYTYIPLIGIFIMIAWGGALLLTKLGTPKMAGPCLAGAGVGALLWLTQAQVRVWRDDESLFSHALKAVPNNHVAHSLLGKALAKAGNREAAIAHFQAALTAYPNHADAHFDIGWTYYAMGKIEEAIPEFQAQLAARPNHLPSYMGLGAAYWKLGRDDEAQESFASALRLNPEVPEANHGLGTVLLAKGQFEAATGYLWKAVEQRPDFLQAQESLGQVLAIQAQHLEALEYLSKVVTTDSRPELQAWLGVVLAETGHTNEANGWLEAAKQKSPELTGQFLTEGARFIANQQPQTAAQYFRMAARLSPTAVEAYDNLGATYAALGEFPEAIRHFETASQLKPTAERYYNLAIARAMTGDFRMAITNLEETLRLKPEWPAALNELAWILATHPNATLRSGARAVELAEKACRIAGETEPRYWGTLDAAYAEAGRFAEAIRTAEKTRDLAKAKDKTELAEAAELRLTQYRENKPFHQ